MKRRFGSKKGRFLPQKETLAAQRALDYGALGWPAVSICVPLYNTPQKMCIRDSYYSKITGGKNTEQ